ncbi:DNA translocase FtsK 4TM domain-containing protein, partial [Candidatus Nomurabacteria bacterium]|nr:DNA translocase FtsK 4TM domain-containing protein [Candidatus Nomurabacteria bacterium]
MGRRKKEEHILEATLSQGVIAVLLLVLAAVTTLSFFDMAGTIGEVLDQWILSFLFGQIRFVTPIVILIIAWFVVKDDDVDYTPTHGIGALLFLLTTASLFHMGYATDEMWRQALEGNGGGVFGMLAWVMKTYFGSIASIIVLIAMAIISLLLMFNTLIAHFVVLNRKLLYGLGTFGRGIFSVFGKLFMTKQAQQEIENEDEEDFDDNDEDEEDDLHSFSAHDIGDEEDEEEEDFDDSDEDEEDNDYEYEEPRVPKTHTVAHQPKAVPEEDEGPWSIPVIIKNPPSVNLLNNKKDKPTSGDLVRTQEIIQQTFKEFKIDVTMGEARVGPTVTQYTCKPAKGVKLSRITALSNDLALALAAHPIRIEAPIPGKSLVGIEIPNSKAAMVTLRELLESKPFRSREHNMMMALGRDVGGRAWFADLPRMPHLLIAGATGSGKTVCMNTIILSLLYQNTAETLRFIMVDPKRVELTPYNGIPHLLTPVITNAQQTVNALKWTISEMDRRFELLSKAGNRNLDTYNASHPNNKLPHLVFIIDELADLMAMAANEVEAGIIRLAQMARAVGIHLIVATQRPSVDVITGLMKANIPARIAFSVASITDSRTILDSTGAEKLLGRGDMLFQTAELSKPVRVQGAFISETEMKRIITYLQGDEKPEYDQSIISKAGSGSGTMSMFGGPTDERDSLFMDAKNAVLEAGKASASFLQRKLKVGYARAARILDELEEAGIIGPADGAKPREILVTSYEEEPAAGRQANAFDQASKDPDSKPPAFLDDDQDDDQEYDYDENEEDTQEDEEYDQDEAYEDAEETEEDYDEEDAED